MKAQIKLKQSGGADMYEKEMIIKNKTGLMPDQQRIYLRYAKLMKVI